MPPEPAEGMPVRASNAALSPDTKGATPETVM